MDVKLITITPNAEQTMVKIARVSSPNPDNTNTNLLKYCLKHGHWSVFEHAHATIQIKTTRYISRQILRHKSFAFSELSQRYSEADGRFELVEARAPADKNRQSSVPLDSQEIKEWWTDAQLNVHRHAYRIYDEALTMGIAKEVARALLPEATLTTLYMTGSIRSWIHYVQLRTNEDTQAEHREIALLCKRELTEYLPTVALALEWTS